MPPDSRTEYARRMHRVLEHVDAHLDQPLNLNELAAVAHFSAYHFHRLFLAWMGETVGDYLRRRRIEIAAMRLIAQPRAPVLQVALGVGFGSNEAFARAFKARFGCTASAWRARLRSQSNPDQVVRKLGQVPAAPAADDGNSSSTDLEIPMHVTLIDRAPVHMAYLRYTGPYGDGVAAFWQEKVYPWMVTHQLLAAPRYGISHDDPSITAPEKCRYDAGVEVPAGFVPTHGAIVTTIPGGRYATTRYRGSAQDIGATWSALLREWLAGSDLQLDARPCFEYYPVGSTYDPVGGVFDCEIVIPVAPL